MISIAPLMDILLRDIPVTADAFADVTKGDELVRDVDWYVSPVPWHTIYCRSGGYEVRHDPDGHIRSVTAYLRRTPHAQAHGWGAYRGELVRGLDASMTRPEVIGRLGQPIWTDEWDRPGWDSRSVADLHEGPVWLSLIYTAEDAGMVELILMPAMRIYDDAPRHRRDGYPAGLPPDNAATHMAMFLAWARMHDHLAGLRARRLIDARERSIDDLVMLHERSLTPRGYFSKACGEVLTDEDLDRDENIFARQDYGAFVEDYARLFEGEAETIYHVADSWEVFDRVRPILDRRFERWMAQFGPTAA